MEQQIQEVAEHGNMMPLLFVIMALFFGAATRHFLKRSPIPYTVSLLLIGLGLGLANRLDWFAHLEPVHESIGWAANINPHLILYVFLPTLIFEAAFGMDLHTFRKSLGNATILAVPGIILALLITAAILMAMKAVGLGLEGWSWAMALLFGTVISATDPVAVVALLKELGASKKLATLIEGESLLNDGTAIVIFSVLLLGFTGGEAESGPVMEFFKVALGGILVGTLSGWITNRWVRRVFNDALIEISLIVAMAYLTFFVSEHFLHVSGVLGLVALGLMMGGRGRTRISPEVVHFLHEFWELAAFFANTLIFIIVGVVIASDIQIRGGNLLNLFLLYIGIHLVRAVVIAVLYPFMRRIGYGIDRKESVVLWYGALRGAIGLALALMVAAEAGIEAPVREEFLFYTAGIVALTLIVNATTMKAVVRLLGLTTLSPARASLWRKAREYLYKTSHRTLQGLKGERYLKRAHWDEVRGYLPEMEEVDSSATGGEESHIAEVRRRILEREKSAYWSLFDRGMMGAAAVRRLSDSIDEILDEKGKNALSDRKDLEEEWNTPPIFSKLQSIRILGRMARKYFFERLTTAYDMARAFVDAQDRCYELLKDIREESESGEALLSWKDYEILAKEIDENRILGHTFLRNLRNYYPEVYAAIATRQATRTLLNEERMNVQELLHTGVLDSGEAEKLISSVEGRMKQLLDRPPVFSPPETEQIFNEIPWLEDLDQESRAKISEGFQNRVYAVGDKLVKEDGPPDSVFIILRGKVKIERGDVLLEVVGPGNIIGEMAFLTGQRRLATVKAATPVTVLWMGSSKMQQLMEEIPELEKRLWEFASQRYAMNHLGPTEPYSNWEHRAFVQWLAEGLVIKPHAGDVFDLADHIAILVAGTATPEAPRGGSPLVAPASLEHEAYVFSKDARVFLRKKNNNT